MTKQIYSARQAIENKIELPYGIQIIPAKSYQDKRGTFSEIFRNNQSLDLPSPVQWNIVSSEKNVLRGFHVHKRHWDYLFHISSEMVLGLQDIRRSSPSYNMDLTIRLQSCDLHLIVIPPGVAHGFYFPQQATLVYSVSEYHDLEDELSCKWNDPDVLVNWPCKEPILSERDQAAGTLQEMITKLAD